MQDFPSLILRSQQYTHTNGAVVPLLMAEGTIPMYYQVLFPAQQHASKLSCIAKACQCFWCCDFILPCSDAFT